MSREPSLWTRVRNVISPPRETYDSRTSRPGESADRPGTPIYEATDRRRHGGTMEIG